MWRFPAGDPMMAGYRPALFALSSTAGSTPADPICCAPFAREKEQEIMAGQIEARLADRKIELPKAAIPVANYVPVAIAGNLAFVSGQVTIWNGEFRYKGKLGQEFKVEDGQAAARLCGLNVIAQLKNALGDLDRVKRCVKLTVFVNSTDDFPDQPKVANGASDLMVEVFGDAGKHARAAVGVNVLPLNVAVEVEGVFEIA
jgi:enamine deaminase RidA (YjgF/YER057c/UK114 family)